MQIKFNTNTFDVTTKTIEGVEMFSLKDVENGWKEGRPEGASAKALENWVRKEDIKELVSLREIHVVNLREGRSFITYGDKDALIEYASHCSVPFRSAVRKAFLAAASGDANKAVDIATSVVIDPKLIKKEARLRKQFTQVIKEKMPDDKHAYSNFNRLLGKCFSGYTPKQLTDARMSAFAYAVHLGHTDGVGAYLAALRMAIQGVSIGLDYHEVAAMLEVQTGKNKDILVK